MSDRRTSVFLGSSSEGRPVAQALQVEIGDEVEVVRWDQSVFEPGGYALDSLITAAHAVDFAVLVATPDDTTTSRSETEAAPRDNIVLEFGLFAGVLGRDRTYLLPTGPLKLPTDVLGLTTLRFAVQLDLRAAVTPAALQVLERSRTLGRRARQPETGSIFADRTPLEREIDLLVSNAVSQGWAVKTRSETTLRLVSPKGKPFTLSKTKPLQTREDLRPFVAALRAHGLRANSAIRRPIEQSPFGG